MRCGIVLAGGRSSRMGRDKAAMAYRGLRLVDHMAALLRRAGAETVLISGPGGVPDAVAGLGPLEGIRSAAAALPASRASLIVVPVDMPRLSAAALERLFRVIEDGARAAHFQAHELPAAFAPDGRFRSALERLLGLCAPRERSVGALLRLFDAATTQAPDPAELLNVNTPQEWEALSR